MKLWQIVKRKVIDLNSKSQNGLRNGLLSNSAEHPTLVQIIRVGICLRILCVRMKDMPIDKLENLAENQNKCILFSSHDIEISNPEKHQFLLIDPIKNEINHLVKLDHMIS